MAELHQPSPGIPRHHQHTLECLFAHPLHHDLRTSQVEALLRSLGAAVTPLAGRRLRIQMPGGDETWIRTSCGVGRPFLDADALMRVRHLLQAAGVSPDHPIADLRSPRGDQARRLVLHLTHAHTDAFLLEGDTVEHGQLRPHGLWGSGENLSHRHDRDIAGQRAPLDHAYLRRIVEAMEQADVVLLLGHGTGESDMRQLLLTHLQTHHRELLERIVGVVTLDHAHPSDAALLALAREHFGNLPQRHQLPGGAGAASRPPCR
jgi:hypothetical protein